MAKGKLTAKQAAFVQEYLVDLNATQAAIRAGYSKKTARQIGEQNLSKVDVSTAVQQAMKERETRTGITADRVLKELEKIAFFDIRKLYNEDGSMKLPSEWDDDTAAAMAGLETIEEFEGTGKARKSIGFTKKAKTWSKDGALGLAMRHLGMLVDRQELTGKDGQPLQPSAVNVRVVIAS
jgi:phage terminase small subunit